MAEVPEQLTLERNRDLQGMARRPWARWIILTAVACFAILGLLDVFGQRPATSEAASPRATLRLYAPTHLRGGLLFSARFRVTAVRELKNAILVLDPGWAESMSINTIEPGPLGEGSANGRITLQLGHVPKGESHELWLELQVNPTNIAWRRAASVTLADGSTPLVHIRHHFTIYP
jgi:hypothetical protein